MAGCAALVLAGGSGSRFGGAVPKQYLELAGRGVLRRAAEAFISHPRIDLVRMVIRTSDRVLYDEMFDGLNVLAPVEGGVARQDSVRLGLVSLAEAAPDRVLIHDGARPFVDPLVIDRVLDALEGTPAAVPVLGVNDTIKRGDGTSQHVVGTVDRTGLWRAQTPQGFRYSEILAAHRAVEGEALTDDAAIAEHAGLAVAMVEGSEDNIKITSSEDLQRAERLFAGRPSESRTGIGFDVHRFTPGDQVMLCGVAIPHDQGLEGHSDADVGLHALTDAILGAIGAGDIGTHFPPSDAKWRDAPSDIFLAHAGSLVTEGGGEISNLDVTLITEAPKIGPHREAMRQRIGKILAIPTAAVSVKATTTEGLGFTGRGEGIAAQAVATVRLLNRSMS